MAKDHGSIQRGVTADGDKVTVQFGEGPNVGHTLTADGHQSAKDFHGKSGQRGHDHHHGKGGGTKRGKYNR